MARKKSSRKNRKRSGSGSRETSKRGRSRSQSSAKKSAVESKSDKAEELVADESGSSVATLEKETEFEKENPSSKREKVETKSGSLRTKQDTDVADKTEDANKTERNSEVKADADSESTEDSWELISAKYADKLAKEEDTGPAVGSKESPESVLDRVANLFDEEDSLNGTAEADSKSALEERSSDSDVPADFEQLAKRLESRVDSVFADLERRVEKLFARHAEQLSVSPESNGTTSANTVSASSESGGEDSAGEDSGGEDAGWEATKRSMMSKYGEIPADREKKKDYEDAPSEDDATSNSKAKKNTSGSSSDSDLSGELSPENAEAIQELKDKLTSQLREAEIELSISRAKMSQQRARLEQMQVDIERREKALERNLNEGFEKTKGRSRILDRWFNRRNR